MNIRSTAISAAVNDDQTVTVELYTVTLPSNAPRIEATARVITTVGDKLIVVPTHTYSTDMYTVGNQLVVPVEQVLSWTATA